MRIKGLAKKTAAMLLSVMMIASGVSVLLTTNAVTTTAKAATFLSGSAVKFSSETTTIRPNQSVKTTVEIDSSQAKAPYKVQFGYKFSRTDNNINYVKNIEKTTQTKITYEYTQFTQVSNYEAVVKVTDATGASNFYSIPVFSFKVLTGNLTTDSPCKIGINSCYDAHIKVSGGVYNTFFHFVWGYYLSNGKEIVVDSYDCINELQNCQYKFNTPGVYTPFVRVDDALSNHIELKLPKVTVSDFKVNFGKVSSSYKISPQQAFQASATVSGGTAPYKYKFSYRSGALLEKTTVYNSGSTYSPSTTYAYKLTDPGYYYPVLEVVDAKGVTSIQKLSRVTVIDFKAAFKTSSSYKIKKSQSFNTSVTVSEGKANYTYRFGYTLNGKKTYVNTQKLSSATASYSYKFPAKGSYVPFVEVTDGQNLYTSSKLSTVTVID